MDPYPAWEYSPVLYLSFTLILISKERNVNTYLFICLLIQSLSDDSCWVKIYPDIFFGSRDLDGCEPYSFPENIAEIYFRKHPLDKQLFKVMFKKGKTANNLGHFPNYLLICEAPTIFSITTDYREDMKRMTFIKSWQLTSMSSPKSLALGETCVTNILRGLLHAFFDYPYESDRSVPSIILRYPCQHRIHGVYQKFSPGTGYFRKSRSHAIPLGDTAVLRC